MAKNKQTSDNVSPEQDINVNGVPTETVEHSIEELSLESVILSLDYVKKLTSNPFQGEIIQKLEECIAKLK